jgi:predicted RND superfamily exporter protein
LHPKRVLLLAAVVTFFTAPGIKWLKLRTDGRSLVSKTAPEVVYDQSIRDQFGIEDQLVVLIQSHDPEGIFNPGTVQLIRTLTAKFQQMPGVNPLNVISLATEPSFRLRPDTRLPQTVLEPPLTNRLELDQLRDDLRKIQLYTGTLVSADGGSSVILLGAPDGGDNTQLYQRVLDVIDSTPSPPDEIEVTGAPVAEALFGIHILEDLGVPRPLLGVSTRSSSEHGRWQMPSSLYELRLLLVQRIGLLPMAILVMMFIFFLSFRNVLATLLPLPGIVATLLFLFGLMGWCGVPIYLTIPIVPVLLTSIGVTNDIYLFNRYFNLLRQRPGSSHASLVQETFDKLASPVAITSITAAIGLMSFALSPLGPVKAFGVVSSLGVLFGLFYSLTVIPALLVLIPPAWLMPRRRPATTPDSKSPDNWFTRLGPMVTRHRWRVAGLLIVLAVLLPFGLRRLVIQDSWTDGFDPHSEFRRVTQKVNQNYNGMHLLFVSFDAPEMLEGEIPPSAINSWHVTLPGELVEDTALLPGSSLSIFPSEERPAATLAGPASPAIWQTHIEAAVRIGTNIILRTPRGTADPATGQALSGSASKLRFEITVPSHLKPDIIRSIGDLGAFIRSHGEDAVGGVLGPADYLMTTRFMLQPDNPDSRVLPGSAGETRQLWSYYQTAVGSHRVHQMVNADYSRSLTTVFLKDANFVDTARLMGDIRAYEHEHLTPKGIRLGFAGDIALSQSLIQGIVTTQMQSLFWSVAGIWLVTSWLGGSLRWGIYCVLPSLVAIVIKFALMGWFGIPLGVATSMFAATTLGIGVSCAIHLLEGFRQARAAGVGPSEAVSGSLGLTGPPALINTLAVSLGFGVLMLSQVPANARLGFLLVVGLVNCFVVSILLLPVLLHKWPITRTPQSETD